MPSKTVLRDAFREGEAPTRTIDTKRVIARSKRRRLPRQVGAGTAFTFAIAGISVAGVAGLASRNGSSPSGAVSSASGTETTAANQELAAGGDAAVHGHGKRIPAEGINACGQQLAVRDAAANGLVLTAHFPYASSTTGSVEGVVTLTNTGDTTVDGWSIDPTVTLSQDGLVLWHGTSSTSASGIETHLAPGESVDFASSFEPVTCSADQETGSTLPAGLPAVAAGEYQVSAAMDISGDAYDAILVTGPVQTITLK